MSRKERKSLVAALLVAAFVATSAPALAAKQQRNGDDAFQPSWVTRVLDWLALRPIGGNSAIAPTSANIDPNGQPDSVGEIPGGPMGTNSSANIDPDG